MRSSRNLRADAEHVLQKLGLHYRVLLMCAGDLGFTQTKKYDLEVWSVGQQKWLEVSSVSNFESYQARRHEHPLPPRAGGKPEIVHTLNGSALALPRVVAALLETVPDARGESDDPKGPPPLHRIRSHRMSRVKPLLRLLPYLARYRRPSFSAF